MSVQEGPFDDAPPLPPAKSTSTAFADLVEPETAAAADAEADGIADADADGYVGPALDGTDAAPATPSEPVPSPEDIVRRGHAAALAQVDVILETFDVRLRSEHTLSLRDLRAIRQAVRELKPADG